MNLADLKSNAATSLRRYARLLTTSPASLVSEVDHARKRAADDLDSLARADGNQHRAATAMRCQILLRGHVSSADALRWASEYHPDPRALALAHTINDGDTEEGAAIRAHLITMGWRPPT